MIKRIPLPPSEDCPWHPWVEILTDVREDNASLVFCTECEREDRRESILNRKTFPGYLDDY